MAMFDIYVEFLLGILCSKKLALPTLRKVPGTKAVKLLVGYTCKIPRSTQRSCKGIRRSPDQMCQDIRYIYICLILWQCYTSQMLHVRCAKKNRNFAPSWIHTTACQHRNSLLLPRPPSSWELRRDGGSAV